MTGDGMDRIKHLIVGMMENRSFDNLLGFLYADVNNIPPINIPAPPPGGKTTFDGLVQPNPTSDYWNPSNNRWWDRSEEHTSELQSHLNLVCRLLLEKKKTTNHGS